MRSQCSTPACKQTGLGRGGSGATLVLPRPHSEPGTQCNPRRSTRSRSGATLNPHRQTHRQRAPLTVPRCVLRPGTARPGKPQRGSRPGRPIAELAASCHGSLRPEGEQLTDGCDANRRHRRRANLGLARPRPGHSRRPVAASGRRARAPTGSGDRGPQASQTVYKKEKKESGEKRKDTLKCLVIQHELTKIYG